METSRSKQNVLDALEHLPASAKDDYDTWLHVGMALKYEGFDVGVWDSWSRSSARYKPGACDRKWATFDNDRSETVTGATIIQAAKENGWLPNNGVFEWDSYIEYDGDGEEPPSDSKPKVSLLNAENWDPKADLRLYISTLFEPDDYVGYVVKSEKGDDGRLILTEGCYARTAKQILDALDQSSSIEEAIGDYNPEAGAWIRFNPLDGQGVKDQNVTDFRYTLIESDNLSVVDQEAAWRRLQLPIAAMVSSGGKSIHAIVRIDAANAKEYRKRVQDLYAWIEKQEVRPGEHITIDNANRNPSRLSRMPGVTRNGQQQRLLAVNIGRKSWTDWMDWVQGEVDDLPPILSYKEYVKHPLELKPVLIEGLLRQTHKLLVTGDSKSGKSFALIQLAVCIAEGLKWFGKLQCTKGKVLYINFEIDDASAWERVRVVSEKLCPGGMQHPEDLHVWNMRGHSQTLKQLVPKLERRCRDQHYSAIIFDPIYKIIEGDENSASDMGAFCNGFDKVAAQTGASPIYAHHHTKGKQSDRKAIDRGSGSGVFGRDPDAILDMTVLAVPENIMYCVADGNETALRVEAIVREFPPIDPFDMWFKWPVHEVDAEGVLAGCTVGDEPRASSGKYSTPESRLLTISTAYDALNEGRGVKVTDMVKYFDGSPANRTIHEWMAKDEFKGKFEISGGVLWKLRNDDDE